ncbi:MAG TPA: DUF2853 family protein [Robiginitalea sp.]|nr:DUF2853 family protein [Robiginitalea sp.]
MGSKKDEWLALYAADIRSKFGQEPDPVLLGKVTDALGPAIYNRDACKVSGSSESELHTVKTNFLQKKLGLADGPELMAAIRQVLEAYGKSERNKYRAVVYYMLARHFNRESVYL